MAQGNHLAQIISSTILTIVGTPARSLQLHIKVAMEILMPQIVACVSLVDACSAIKICMIMVKII